MYQADISYDITFGYLAPIVNRPNDLEMVMSCFLVFTGVFHLKTPVESFVVLNDWMKRDKLHIVYEASRKTRANGGGFVFGYFLIFSF